MASTSLSTLRLSSAIRKTKRKTGFDFRNQQERTAALLGGVLVCTKRQDPCQSSNQRHFSLTPLGASTHFDAVNQAADAVLLPGVVAPMVSKTSCALQNISGLKKLFPGALVGFRPFMDLQTATQGIFMWQQLGHPEASRPPSNARRRSSTR